MLMKCPTLQTRFKIQNMIRYIGDKCHIYLKIITSLLHKNKVLMLCPSRLTTEYTRVYTNTEEHKTWRIIILQNERTNKQTNKQKNKKN